MWKITNTAFDRNKELLHRQAAKFNPCPMVGGKVLRRGDSITISDEVFATTETYLRELVRTGVIVMARLGVTEDPSGIGTSPSDPDAKHTDGGIIISAPKAAHTDGGIIVTEPLKTGVIITDPLKVEAPAGDDVAPVDEVAAVEASVEEVAKTEEFLADVEAGIKELDEGKGVSTEELKASFEGKKKNKKNRQ
jgi:hypothetical protein